MSGVKFHVCYLFFFFFNFHLFCKFGYMSLLVFFRKSAIENSISSLVAFDNVLFRCLPYMSSIFTVK